ncbi:MAG: hypothetical protein JST89_12065 [Cyanobacteria bacterium SZAS-4]|nr:hypothetical protein [Cyanobacteria bacterium SZAS-4]
MKVQRAPLVAATLIFLAGAVMPPAYTQLPPTNMGKWVHQPGDNQYGQSAQNSRHALPPQMTAPVQTGGGGGGYVGWTPAPRPYKPDVSLDPIAADEPVPPAGFPPLPDRLDLPVQSSWAGGGGRGGWGGGGGGNSYGGASAPGMSGGGSSGPQFSGSHQHYNHYEPGSFGQSASHGYYKANTPPPPGSDYYASGSGGGPGTGGAAPSEAEMALRRMGKEPKLNNKNDVAGTPEAPQPVVVNQATTQDLSLPEDDFAYQKPGQNNTMGKRLGRSVKRAVLRPLNSAGSYAGISF